MTPTHVCMLCGELVYGISCTRCAPEQPNDQARRAVVRRVVVFTLLAGLVLCGVHWMVRAEIRAGIPLMQPGPINVEVFDVPA